MKRIFYALSAVCLLCLLLLTASGCVGGGDAVQTEQTTTSSSTGNNMPTISSGPTVSPYSIQAGQTSVISVTASDADNDSLTYTFSAGGGTLSPSTVTGSGTAVVTYTAPYSSGTYTISVIISDSNDASASGSANVAVTPLTAKWISAGLAHTCAVTTSGGVKCWGSNSHSQLGIAFTYTNDFHASPVDATGMSSGVIVVAVGEDEIAHSCALTTAGGVKCWGNSTWGELGIGSTTTTGPDTCNGSCSYIPLDVTGLSSGVTALAAGGGHNCAVTSSGGVKCWGRNSS